ncbi:unnamed protein product [Cyprideis torosa]|uniref:Uncharacterized protein n=1 Tax=Cyprideis torosa TaxID=163714 RepID=A0A7R8W371_9CRUS|nr:unnamed protein product [Cyprideis torosa]CAG0881830.1 unnamed protein product [Cyprideis torosa]
MGGDTMHGQSLDPLGVHMGSMWIPAGASPPDVLLPAHLRQGSCPGEDRMKPSTCNRTEPIRVTVDLGSAPCVLGGCNDHGECKTWFTRSGFVFSSCHCNSGYRGWGCTDTSEAVSETLLIVQFFLLTLSNLAFLPAVVLATKRHFYMEAITYFFCFAFSTLYHACDTEAADLLFCISPYYSLQFADFMCGIFAFWMTLLMIASLPLVIHMPLVVLGAVGCAFATRVDLTGLWPFVIPTASAGFIVVVSWVSHCIMKRRCFPRPRFWFLHLVPGLAVAGLGLGIYAGLQTTSNYAYLHSVWHVGCALSVLILIPQPEDMAGDQEASLLPMKGIHQGGVDLITHLPLHPPSDAPPPPPPLDI